MRAADRATTEQFGIPSIDLMHHAGNAVARFVESEYPQCRRVIVLCGRGNNGGDGFVAARALAAAGRDVTVLLLGHPDDLKGDAKVAYAEMQLIPILVSEESALDSSKLRAILTNSDLLIDAVVGTGFQPPLRGAAAALRDRVNRLDVPIIALDLPSGWDADFRSFNAEGAFRANAVVTFTAPKLAHVFGNLTRAVNGPIVVAPIGSPPEVIQSTLNLTWSGFSHALVESRRPADSNKGMFGHVLVIGGGRGKSGAPAMASLAALRTGAGLVTAAVVPSILSNVAAVTPELMTAVLPEGSSGEVTGEDLDYEELLDKKTVLAVGPGLGQHSATEAFLVQLLGHTQLPVVLDADALNILAKHPGQIDGRDRTMVLTPHPGEMARLAGVSTKDVQADRESLAREFAMRHQVTLLLKGWRTLVAHPNGTITINTTGNPGMAKGGSGDILTGIVAAMIAQHPDQVADAVNAAAYIHGLAADIAVIGQDEHTLLATDTVSHLWRAFRFRPADPVGYVWLQGLPSGFLETYMETR
jgi:ADP-dependent NAD(P)H-hydrate dehydratase / NAD(P)H-hydrate epimerase